jgi:hypothetical protein
MAEDETGAETEGGTEESGHEEALFCLVGLSWWVGTEKNRRQLKAAQQQCQSNAP